MQNQIEFALCYLQEIRNCLHSGSLIHPNLIAPHYEALPIRLAVLRQAPLPQPVRQGHRAGLDPTRPTFRAYAPGSPVRNHRDNRSFGRQRRRNAGKKRRRSVFPASETGLWLLWAQEPALGPAVDLVHCIARKLQHIFFGSLVAFLDQQTAKARKIEEDV